MSVLAPVSWATYISSAPDSGAKPTLRHLWEPVTFAEAVGRPDGDFRALCGVKVPRAAMSGAPPPAPMRSRPTRDVDTASRPPCRRCERFAALAGRVAP